MILKMLPVTHDSLNQLSCGNFDTRLYLLFKYWPKPGIK